VITAHNHFKNHDLALTTVKKFNGANCKCKFG